MEHHDILYIPVTGVFHEKTFAKLSSVVLAGVKSANTFPTNLSFLKSVYCYW